MKKLITFFLFILMNLSNSFSQINLENTYPIGSNVSDYPNYYRISIIHFSNIGDKYAVVNHILNMVKIYYLNHSLYKTINIPASTLNVSSPFLNITNISDNLFNTDSKIEVAFHYGQGQSNELSIIDEDGAVIFHKDSATFANSYGLGNPNDDGIFKTDNGYKMAIQYRKSTDSNIEVYSLPGSLTSANIPAKQSVPVNFMVTPNPANSYTKIDFEMDKGEQGELYIYNDGGKMIKSYQVDDAFGSLLLNSSDLPSGQYYYQVHTSKNKSGTKKVIIIH